MSDQRLEPEAENILRNGKKSADELSNIPALYSIAISLKRIADMMEISHKQSIIMSAEEYARYQHKLNTF